jgi:hypothetical protein
MYMPQKFSYTTKRSKRARRVRLAVHPDGSVVVTGPIGAPQAALDRFVAEKREWILDKLKRFEVMRQRFGRPLSREDYLKHKEQARALIYERLRIYNEIYNFSYNKVFIKNQKTCWGSCSSKKNLNFNYKILFLPKEQQDYIIVHELCHLKEMNHSPKFWALVKKSIPNYRDIKKQLRSSGMLYK